MLNLTIDKVSLHKLKSSKTNASLALSHAMTVHSSVLEVVHANIGSQYNITLLHGAFAALFRIAAPTCSVRNNEDISYAVHSLIAIMDEMVDATGNMIR